MHRWSGVAVSFVVALALFAFLSLSGDGAEAGIAESGPIENLAVAAYAALILALLAISHRSRTFLVASAVVVALMAARELDLHKAFTTDSLFNLRTYTGDTVPLWEKLVVGAVALAIISFVIWYAFRYGAWLWRSLRSGSAIAYSILAGTILLVLAKVLDAFARTLRELTGIEVDTGITLQLLEEVFETAAPFVFLWALLTWSVVNLSRRGSPSRTY